MKYETGYHSSDEQNMHVAAISDDGRRDDLFDVNLYDGDALAPSRAALERLVTLANVVAEHGDLLCEALDSHAYWQLSDENYRDSGFVTDPGSDDPDMAKAITMTNQLIETIRAALEERTTA